MTPYTTPAILIRRVDYGDYDLILTFLTRNRGKISLIAKSAKRSKKRFGGLLELFNSLDIVVSRRRGRGLAVIQEASLIQPLFNIAADIRKTAYASYWAELVNLWLEEERQQKDVYDLLAYVLTELDAGTISGEVLSILFQMRFLDMSGLCPNLSNCCTCRIEIDAAPHNRMNVDLSKGGVVCERCAPYGRESHFLSKGTIKQLQWIGNGDLHKAARIRFSDQALKEGLHFLESFVPYHLGKEPRSLKFLRRIRL
ncbi:MAG: DNA repair protein RecO [Deltaproteobacteria bacterium]|nr:DNA repair protein RecO [Deltaproteobacteria bacterium]